MIFSPVRPLRISLLSDEHVSLIPNAGGLAQYVNRISRALSDLGHRVEIFTRATERPGVVEENGIRTHAVPDLRTLPLRVFGWLGRLNWRLLLPMTNQALCTAAGLNQALVARHRQAPFDLVQSSNLSLSGLFVRLPGAVHLTRMSCARDLWFESDGFFAGEDWLDCRTLSWLERVAMDRATAVFAPSQFLARYFAMVHGRQVAVVRPPAWIETKPAEALPFSLPPRFLVHFGSLQSRKGADWLGAALLRAWQQEPELRMVWAGRVLEEGLLERLRRDWGPHHPKVTYVGALPRDQLYALVKRAEATVLPSRVDNLPNTAIESLSLGVPVIGSAGASLDELVEDNRSGSLVRIGDTVALAAALVKTWRRQVPWLGDGFVPPQILAEMQPARAACRLLAAAGLPSGEPGHPPAGTSF